jgi:hypothetical protein
MIKLRLSPTQANLKTVVAGLSTVPGVLCDTKYSPVWISKRLSLPEWP